MKLCRNCGEPLSKVFLDLGHTPLANSYLTEEQLDEPEITYPLKALVCDKCLLVQLGAVTTPDAIFCDYAYFSGTSPSWVELAREYCSEMIGLLNLNTGSLVVEVGSNDGYLLQHFQTSGIPVQGVDPARNIAGYANTLGIPTLPEFFGEECARAMVGRGQRADLLCGTNVLAHVPDLHDFVEGIRILLKPTGVVTMEFPHIMNLLSGNQFDTIYHEHFSYFSLRVVQDVFASHDIGIFDVEELPTHGGSIRIHGRKGASAGARVLDLLERESAAGLDRMETYTGYGSTVMETKLELIGFLLDAREAGLSVVCYGAPAKGNTLLNYCGIGSDLIEYTVDDSPHKQNLFLPGSHIPIFPSSKLLETKPDIVLILPWNLSGPIIERNPEVAGWGGQWFVPIPKLTPMS